MMYIIEAIAPTENLVTLYWRSNIDDACRWAEFLKDKYHVEAEVFEEYEYRKLHPENFHDLTF